MNPEQTERLIAAVERVATALEAEPSIQYEEKKGVAVGEIKVNIPPEWREAMLHDVMQSINDALSGVSNDRAENRRAMFYDRFQAACRALGMSDGVIKHAWYEVSEKAKE